MTKTKPIKSKDNPLFRISAPRAVLLDFLDDRNEFFRGGIKSSEIARKADVNLRAVQRLMRDLFSIGVIDFDFERNTIEPARLWRCKAKRQWRALVATASAYMEKSK